MQRALRLLSTLVLLFISLACMAERPEVSVHLNANDVAWDSIGGDAASWSEEYQNKGSDAQRLSEIILLKTLVGHPDKGLPDQDMKPNAVHQLEVISDERIVVVWADWAPNGDKSVHDAGFKILAPVPQQPDSAKIAQQ